MTLSPIDYHIQYHMQLLLANKKCNITAYPTNNSCTLNNNATSHGQSETAYETKKPAVRVPANIHISHANISPIASKLGSSQQNGPICKGPAHDCARGRSLL